VGPERGPFSLVSRTEELERKSSGCGQGNEIRRADYATPLYPQKLELTLPTSGGRSVGIVRSRTQAAEFVLFVCLFIFTETLSEGRERDSWKQSLDFLPVYFISPPASSCLQTLEREVSG
jgi:hypothetical protein